MKRAIRILTAACGLLLAALGAGPAGAAEIPAPQAPAVSNPHGDLKTECEACHTAKSWKTLRKPILFKHATTGFPLEGRHASAECVACHHSLEFRRVATACNDCHHDVHEGKSGTRCQDCHTTSSWTNRSAALAQHSKTGFPLRGVHALVECARCHVGSGEANQTPISRDCYPCHTTEYMSTQSPNHISAGFSVRCEECHDPGQARFGGSGFNHALTGFPLTGAHQATACVACHVGGRYVGTPRNCYACHQSDYTGANNPSHQGFSTQCETCHTTSAWQPAKFNHDTFFALTGAHRTATCVSCHVGGVYAGTPRNCYGCHQSDYANTTNPDHTAQSYSTSCETCHSTSAWQPANINHDQLYFRINSGRHAGKWSTCTICHQNSANYGDFTCLSCHEHAQGPMDSQHQGRSGYSYDSNACYGCHGRV